MHWPIIGFTAVLAILMPPCVSAQPNEPDASWCDLACAADPLTVPAWCNCNATITPGSGGPPPPGGDGGEQTIQTLFDEMIATYEAEIAQVQNYLLIEKSKAAPMADFRYYEKKSSNPGNTGSDGGDDGFVWVPNHELARRDLAANPSNNKTGNSRTEVPQEFVDDPTLYVNALGDALEILAGFAGAGELGAALGETADQEAQKIRGSQQESRDGIEGADTLGGLLTDKPLSLLFWPGDGLSRFGFYKRDLDEFVLPEKDSVMADLAECYALLQGSKCPSLSKQGAPCFVKFISKDVESPESSSIPQGSVIESGQLWYCDVSDTIKPDRSQTRPVRLKLTYLDADLTRVTIHEENKDFVRRGPMLIPRRIQHRISKGAEFFVDELEREVRVNLGPPTQADLAELLGETMDWDTFYQTQGSP